MKPSMPPAPFENGIFESATAIIEPIQTSQVAVKLLNLTVADQNTGDNSIKAVLDVLSTKHKVYNDAPLSGSLDQIHSDI